MNKTGVAKLEECYEIAKNVQISEKEIKPALQFFSDFNIILYYPRYFMK